jgi:hypothetical protein
MPPEKAVVTRILRPEDWIDRQIGNLKAVGEKNYAVGIAAPKRDPIAAGIAAEPVYAAEVKLAIEEQRRAKALMATNIDEWYKYASEIGKGRLVDGVTKREKEVHDFVKPWQPILLDHLSKIDPMSTVTLKDRIEKAVKNMEGLAALRGTWRGR